MKTADYWQECLANAAEECGLRLTREQTVYLAEAVEGAHDNYGMAFYSPPASDRIADIERDWKVKCERLERELQQYRTNAEKAVVRAMKLRPDATVSIGEYGSVELHDGRTYQIQ